MKELNKKIELLSSPEAQQRLKEGVLQELARADQKIKNLESDKEKLSKVAKVEAAQKHHEKKLKVSDF